ncbi:MBL fold metallo-hydrolase [Polynucleobacter paneuropaeus]|uniref:MBL fold metallo-hydrolase n=1 Tax=Polynucleobacter paneuropaeus TaxID=2527775 RepID=UPI000DBEFAE1|nr:MBL fold metallo-hydrolase [Polynucleobacter paneuropaeus]AWW45116.1 Zn-dependent hydrolase [Polynucleobacter paneuropaeus]MBT8574042.1 MBL fold metallo-hydrolase [Polynucleobacter paneuropaeus]QWD45723.1 MBL fold metallo-hydrolase [Polynucleobacter paneuropaeus]QWD47498.1 MBL fold metallo-hydrolase [Polynucleobacter paneuropaeus]
MNTQSQIKVDQERAVHYPLADQLPQNGQCIELAKGVYWLRMRLPFALDHINLWLLQDQMDGVSGWTIVDCGIANEETKAAWEQIFANQLKGLPILRVIVTHMHPDHIGLSQWLCERWNVRLWISMTDYLTAQWLSHKEGGAAIGSKAGSGGSADHFQKHGLTAPEDLEKIRGRSNYFSNMVPGVPRQYRRIVDGEQIAIGGHDWQVIMGFGHAPEHASLFCKDLGVLISGDMLLPRISTNVSVYDADPDADPLGLYLDSLERFLPLPDDTLVLPSHGKPFQGMKARVAQLKLHHDERLAETMAACQKPAHAREIVPVLFRRELDIHQMTFAMGEAIAHLNYLLRRGKLRRQLCDDGVLRFSVV